MYQTKPPGLVGNKNETPSSPTLLPTSRMSVALVLVTFAPKTFPTFVKGVNVIAPPAAQISLRNSRREIFPATNQELVTILLNNITIEAWINGIYIFTRWNLLHLQKIIMFLAGILANPEISCINILIIEDQVTSVGT
jgi:hypothetical protein